MDARRVDSYHSIPFLRVGCIHCWITAIQRHSRHSHQQSFRTPGERGWNYGSVVRSNRWRRNTDPYPEQVNELDCTRREQDWRLLEVCHCNLDHCPWRRDYVWRCQLGLYFRRYLLCGLRCRATLECKSLRREERKLFVKGSETDLCCSISFPIGPCRSSDRWHNQDQHRNSPHCCDRYRHDSHAHASGCG